MTPTSAKFGPRLDRVFMAAVPVMVAAVLAAAVTLDQQSKNLIKVLALIGLLTLIFDWHASWAAIKRLAPALFAALLLFFCSALLSVVFNPIHEDTFRNLEKLSYSVGVIGIWVLLVKCRFKADYFWWGVLLCALSSGLYAIGEMLVHDISTHRAGGSSGRAIMFGDVAMASALMLTGSLRHFSRYRQWWLRRLPYLAMLLGITASLLSGSRGGWIALPAVALLVGWYYLPSIGRWRRRHTLFFIFILLLGGSLLLHSPVIYRIESAWQQWANYRSGEQVAGSSIGARIEMWRAAVSGFRESPMVGIGIGGVQDLLQRLADRGEIDPYVASYERNEQGEMAFSHVHNQYLNALVTRGVIGLLADLAIFFLSFWILARAASQRASPLSDIALAGLALVISYIHFALTESVLSHPMTLNFFFLSLIVILYLIEFSPGRVAREN